MFSLPENTKIVQAITPTIGLAAAMNATPVSLKNCHRLYAVCHVSPVGGAAMAFVPQTDTLVAFASATALANTVRIWANEDVGTDDTLVEQTAAVNFTTTADVNNKLVIFEIDPANLTAGEDCFRISITNVPATDYVSVEYYMVPRHASRVSTQATAITD